MTARLRYWFAWVRWFMDQPFWYGDPGLGKGAQRAKNKAILRGGPMNRIAIVMVTLVLLADAGRLWWHVVPPPIPHPLDPCSNGGRRLSYAELGEPVREPVTDSLMQGMCWVWAYWPEPGP